MIVIVHEATKGICCVECLQPYKQIGKYTNCNHYASYLCAIKAMREGCKHCGKFNQWNYIGPESKKPTITTLFPVSPSQIALELTTLSSSQQNAVLLSNFRPTSSDELNPTRSCSALQNLILICGTLGLSCIIVLTAIQWT